MLFKRIGCCLLLFSFFSFSCEAGRGQKKTWGCVQSSPTQSRTFNAHTTEAESLNGSCRKRVKAERRRLGRLWKESSTCQKASAVSLTTLIFVAGLGVTAAYAAGAFDGPKSLKPSCNSNHILVNSLHEHLSCRNGTLQQAEHPASGHQCLPGQTYFYETHPREAISCMVDGQWGPWVKRNATESGAVSTPSSKQQSLLSTIGKCTPGQTRVRVAAVRHPGGTHTCDSQGEWSWAENAAQSPIKQNPPCGELGDISPVDAGGHYKCMGPVEGEPSGWSLIEHGAPVVLGAQENTPLRSTPHPLQKCLLDVRMQASCHTPGYEHLQCWEKKCGDGTWTEEPIKIFDLQCRYTGHTACSEGERRGVAGECWINSCSGVEFTEIWNAGSSFMISTQYGDSKLPQDIKNLCEPQIQDWRPHVLGVKGSNTPHRVVVTVNTAREEDNTTGGIVRLSPSHGLVDEGVINLSPQHFPNMRGGTVLCAHEMGHVLVTTQSPGSNPNYDRYIDESPRGAPYTADVSHTYFYGPRTMEFYGGPVPVNNGLWRGQHWAYDLVNQRTGEPVSGLPINNGHATNRRIGVLNWCAMSDLGWDTVGCPVPDVK